ncbi:hypothetical protein F7725_012872 [Dissostichus mawsoni]|uniref:Uncharacterized protein n=1 Tax=Dissostichus mawsoni TaxID=36200 RepID=A0A7J5YNX7_DISMA|nr:hypothetical protein F7725_012872 [Dissostichus mawsoni]
MVIYNSVFSTMYHLSRNGARFQMFAPNQQQMHVMDHMKKQPGSGENRNMMMESARFSHGQGMMQMQDLSKLDINSFDAVIFPGGHGIIKNLSTFVKDGKDCKLQGDVDKVLKDFHRSRKPIGYTGQHGYGPGLPRAAQHRGDHGLREGRKHPLGELAHTNMVQAVKSMGARHNKNKVVSTPSFMWETEYHYHYIFDGIGNMVKHVMRMSTK